MTPVEAVTEAMLAAIGADTVTLAGACWVIPIKTNFTPDPAPTLVDADIADFTGATPKACGAAARPVLVDPATGNLFLNMPPPAGGFLWTASDAVNLPQTIYGVALSSDSTTVEGADLLGTQLLDAPLTLTGAGETVQLDSVTFTLILPALQ